MAKRILPAPLPSTPNLNGTGLERVTSVVVVFSLNIADAILTEAGLSFIGLGLPPDVPDWGYDLSKGHQFLIAGHWWMITFPGVLITLVAAGFSLLGEGLSEMLNPRLSET